MTNPGSDRARWVRLSVIIGVLVALLVVVIVLMSGGGHRIPRHGPGPGDPQPPSSAVAPHVPPPHG